MPTRYLKPGICDSDAIDRCSPMAECLFYRLLVNVDDFGRADARNAVVRAKCFPLKDSLGNNDVHDLLLELQKNGLIYLYESGGYTFLQMQKWTNPPRAKVSKFPTPSDECMQMYASVQHQYTLLPETETETETETDNVVCPHEQIIALYHEILPMLPSVKVWTNKRKESLRARWKEDKERQNLSFWKSFFEYIAKSDFLCGRTEKPFTCTLEWIVNASNFVKILEGNYENR